LDFLSNLSDEVEERTERNRHFLPYVPPANLLADQDPLYQRRYSSEYLGITAEGEFVVHCAEYGGEREQNEAFNPQTLEMRQLSSAPA
jgi:hypothetical protein